MGEVGVVDLDEVAARLPERVKLGVVHFGEPGDQGVLVRVQVLVDAGPAAPGVHIGGRGDADLDRAVGQGPGELEILDRQPALRVAEGAGDFEHRRSVFDVLVLVVEVEFDPAGELDTFDPGQDRRVELVTAELPVRDGRDSGLFLKRNHFADAAVLDLAPGPVGDLAPLVPLQSQLELGRAQEAADMVGAKRRLAGLHDRISESWLSSLGHGDSERPDRQPAADPVDPRGRAATIPYS